ncbi:MAG: hypothetical protein ACREQI_09800 [Candidatus Binataceae bacterium]
MAKAVAVLIGAAAIMALGGCSASERNAPRSAPVQATFLLNTCQQIQPNLYKCPSMDKPLCTPDFVLSNVDCVHIGRKGSVFVQRGIGPALP